MKIIVPWGRASTPGGPAGEANPSPNFSVDLNSGSSYLIFENLIWPKFSHERTMVCLRSLTGVTFGHVLGGHYEQALDGG